MRAPIELFVKSGLACIKGFVKTEEVHRELNWRLLKKKLAEHAASGKPVKEVAAKVFLNHVAPKLFFAEKPTPPETKPGLQTRVTEKIENFVIENLPAKTKRMLALLKENPDVLPRESVLSAINKIVREIYLFQRVRIEGRVAKELYAKQTAHDLIVTKKIPTTPDMAFGCTHACMALVGALKAFGIKNKFVRTIAQCDQILFTSRPLAREKALPHSIVLFEVGGKRYVADPWRYMDAYELGPDSEDKISELRKRGLWVEGEDMWGMGVTSYKHFTKGLSLPKSIPRYLRRKGLT